MTSQTPIQNSDTRPTNSHVNGPGGLNSGPVQDTTHGQSGHSNTNTQGIDYTSQQERLLHQQAPPTHPDLSGQNTQFSQSQGQGQLDHSTAQSQGQYEHRPYTLDRRGHRGPEARARAAEGGAVYEGEKLAHGGQHSGPDSARYRHGAATDPTQNAQFENRGQDATGPLGHRGGGEPACPAGAGPDYESSKLASRVGDEHGYAQGQHGDHFARNAANASADGTGYATGPSTGPTSAAPNVGQTGAGVGTGTGAAAGGIGATHAAHSGVNQGKGHTAGQYNQQPAGTTTAGGTTGAHTGAGTRTTGSGARSGQPNVILGKIQQVGGKLLGDESMKAKGLEREAKGVANVDQKEAERLEEMASARKEKASGVHAGAGPGSARAGIDPTSGTYGRNL